jgi:hypothetical protein
MSCRASVAIATPRLASRSAVSSPRTIRTALGYRVVPSSYLPYARRRFGDQVPHVGATYTHTLLGEALPSRAASLRALTPDAIFHAIGPVEGGPWMSDAIVFISHNKIKPGKFDALKAYAPRVAETIDRDKPGTVVFLMYADPDGNQASIVHVFPDGGDMQRHLEGVDARASEAFELIETTGYEIYGSPNEQVLEMMREYASKLGVGLAVRPDNMAGYVRVGSSRR